MSTLATLPRSIERKDVRPGMWYTMCCALDLARIDNSEELAELEPFDEEDGGDQYVFWRSEEEALLDLAATGDAHAVERLKGVQS